MINITKLLVMSAVAGTMMSAPARADSFIAVGTGNNHGYHDNHGNGHWDRDHGHHYEPVHSRVIFRSNYYPNYYPAYYAQPVVVTRYVNLTPQPQPVVYTNVLANNETDNRYCREFQSQATVAGRPQQTYGTACLQPDGSWEILN